MQINARNLKEIIGVNILRSTLIITTVFLIIFLIMIFRGGSQVFIKQNISDVPISSQIKIKDNIIKKAITIDEKTYDLKIEMANFNSGTLHKGVVQDIVPATTEARLTKIKKLHIDEMVIYTAVPLGFKKDGYSKIESDFIENIDFSEGRIHKGTIKDITVKNGYAYKIPIKPEQLGGKFFSLSFVLDSPQMFMSEGGIFPAILGTFFIVILSSLFALPIGILAAIYLSEYAKESLLKSVIRTAINTLAGVPSIVYGLFGLTVFVIFFNLGVSMLAGSLTMAILILPIIINTSEEAIKSTPYDFREASYGIGATKRQTILNIILPAALPNILTGTIISIGRAAGETAPILFTAAVYSTPNLPKSPMSEVMALPYHIYALMTEGTFPEQQQPIAYGTALVLLFLVMLINIFAVLIRYRTRKEKKW